MNNIQKTTLAALTSLTLITVILIFIIPDSNLIQYIKFAATLVLTLVALATRTGDRTSSLMKIAFIFSLIGDFFLAIVKVIDKEFPRDLFGIGLFLVAYLFLIAAFRQGKVPVRKTEYLYLLPLAGTAGAFFITMHQYLKGIMIPLSIVFAITIVMMTWTAIGVRKRTDLGATGAKLLIAGALLIFISDLTVAYEMFLPAFINPPAWMEAIIRATFTPAWTLFLLVIQERKTGEKQENN